MIDMEGNSIFEITVDHDLWRLANKFDNLYKQVNEIKTKVSSINEIMQAGNAKGLLYEGRGKEEFDLFISAYFQNVDKLSNLYLFCNAYVTDTLTVMMDFDSSLKKSFELGVTEYATKYPDAAKKLFGGKNG